MGGRELRSVAIAMLDISAYFFCSVTLSRAKAGLSSFILYDPSYPSQKANTTREGEAPISSLPRRELGYKSTRTFWGGFETLNAELWRRKR